MEIKINLSDFLCALGAYNEELSYAISYSNKLTKSIHMKPVLLLELGNETNHCKAIREKYEAILNNNMFDNDYEAKIKDAGQSYEEDVIFLSDFIYKLDMTLMVFGEGAKFHKYSILHPQPMEV